MYLIRILKNIFENTETMRKVVCSGVYAWAMKHALGLDLNPSEQTPLDVCKWNIFEPNYTVLKGKDKGIQGYNSVNIL